MFAPTCAVERDLAEHQRRVDAIEDAEALQELLHAQRAEQILWDIRHGHDAEHLTALWNEYMEFHAGQIVDAFWSLGPVGVIDRMSQIAAVFEAFAEWAADQKEAT